ncbi:hypothetical protein [Streptomyces olivaceus]|uniref:hypothetical protein n=1 Tax=Streptomyces olivaceus TaxID=47716 RepID=UPI0004CA2F99|nr:hypothetical protein [Streptomyces olivaceus]MBZ6102720.1 hypothetical protein [Streptomyces olivaceus]MBZ6207521.1 hypothetical protein [Streptomyces olivaceus]
MTPTPADEPPTLEEITAAGTRRQRDADRLKKSSDDLRELVLTALREGHLKPTEVAKASGWTGAHVRKMARDAGIEADERYAERAARLKKAQNEEQP